ncbi:MAG: HD family phosphohydrolase [Thermoguttaceae bacterium]|jgi:putative nucleotidyltransferase with HDIG domain
MLFGHFRSKRDNFIAARLPKKGIVEGLRICTKDLHLGRCLILWALTSIFLCVAVRAWHPPFPFVGGSRPNRDIVCTTHFTVENTSMTTEDKRVARFETPHVYVNDPQKLAQFKEVLTNRVRSILTSTTYEAMSEDDKSAWRLFLDDDADDAQAEAALRNFKETLAEDQELKAFKAAIDKAFQSYAANGILLKLHPAREGNQETIRIYDSGSSPEEARTVPARDVLIGNMFQIKDILHWDYSKDTAQLIFNWIKKCAEGDVTDTTLPPLSTLTEDLEATRNAQNEAERLVPPHEIRYEPGKPIVRSGELINSDMLLLLSKEHQAILKNLSLGTEIRRAFGFFLLVFASTLLINIVIIRSQKKQPRRKETGAVKISLTVYLFMIAVLLLGKFLRHYYHGQFGLLEMIPLLVFAQILTIALYWEIGFIISLLLVLILSVSSTNDIAPFLVMAVTMSLSTFLTRNIEQRTDILFRSLAVMVVTFVISVSVSFLEAFALPGELLRNATFNAVWVLAAALITEAILPFLERFCGVLTPMRLVEMGNPSNPILQTLNNKAPATYNHSMATAMIAENAAEEVGAQTRLVRVGAYFHDIGKAIRPEYFTENQQHGVDPHTGLKPKRSSEIIISHIKDGVSMAENNYKLPKQVVDLIKQHHGTFPVSYFYEKAKAECEKNGEPELSIDEFRYPGPIPQSKEAAILMIADAIESASRSMKDADKGNLRNMLHNIVQNRIQDGQFNECGLTLGEIQKIEMNMLASVLAMNHQRIKYPGQDAAKKDEPKKA